MHDLLIDNRVIISGEIVSEFVYNHECLGEKFFTAFVKITRLSGIDDVIPLMISERLIEPTESYKGCFIEVSGQFRSYNKKNENKVHLVLCVFAREIRWIDRINEDIDINSIEINGYICKEPVYRETPNGRKIADLIVAVNRPYGKSDYIPCIVWERDALWACKLGIGTKISLKGRIQSREYIKKLKDGTAETRTAYEVSASRIDVVESEDNEDGYANKINNPTELL